MKWTFCLSNITLPFSWFGMKSLNSSDEEIDVFVRCPTCKCTQATTALTHKIRRTVPTRLICISLLPVDPRLLTPHIRSFYTNFFMCNLRRNRKLRNLTLIWVASTALVETDVTVCPLVVLSVFHRPKKSLLAEHTSLSEKRHIHKVGNSKTSTYVKNVTRTFWITGNGLLVMSSLSTRWHSISIYSIFIFAFFFHALKSAFCMFVIM